jgi:hypothetical protein
VLPSALANATGMSPLANSASTWRHPPHGAAGFPAPPTIATASMRRSPAATAIATAFRSAQTESGYALFSTLQAANTRPPASTAAPTGNREYGA